MPKLPPLPQAFVNDVDLPLSAGAIIQIIRAAIALTAFSVNDRTACLAAGCDEFETKPIVVERLLDKIASLLKQSVESARARR